ncbi:MAG: DUF393 domain-containing protein [Crocinitomicaceae bacterium]
MSKKLKDKPLVFYDGDCGFCNSSVQFILKKRRKDVYFVALQSDLGKKILNAHQIEIQLDTIYFKHKGKIYDRSSAALRICKSLKFPYLLGVCFLIVPKFIRDAIYNSIAKRRHKLNAGYCVIPSENEKKFFLELITS